MARWKRAMVTGASAGIGRAIARALAADGTDLVLVARDEARLDELAAEVDVACEVLVADLAEPVALARVEDRLRADREGPIDLLVNNAGFGFNGHFHELDLEREAAVVDVNVVALHRLSHVAATAMVARGDGGGILNVSSIAAFAPTPQGATYAATKAFVNALSESLHADLKPFGVHVSALCPGYTHTEFAARADLDVSDVPDRLWQTAEDVAEAGLAGVADNSPVVVPGGFNRAITSGINLLPGSARRFVVGRFAS